MKTENSQTFTLTKKPGRLLSDTVVVLTVLFFAGPIPVHAATIGRKVAGRLLQSSSVSPSMLKRNLTNASYRDYATDPPIPTPVPSCVTVPPTLTPVSPSSPVIPTTSSPVLPPSPYNSVCSQCGYDSAETVKSIKDLVSMVETVSSQYVEDYGEGLRNIVCKDADQPQCGEAIQAQLDQLVVYQDTINGTMVQLKRLACIQPDVAVNTCPLATGTTFNSARVGRLLQNFDVSGIKGPITVPTPRDITQTTKAYIIAKAVIEAAQNTIDALAECGGTFTGDVCSAAVTTAKTVTSIGLIAATATLDGLEANLEDINNSNDGIQFNFITATSDNVLAAHIKLDAINDKADEANRKLDEANSKLDQVNNKLDQVNAKLDQVNGKLDTLLCPFGTTGLDVTVLRQGCDAIDQNCNKVFDECEEDQVPPSIELTQPIPTDKPFRSIQDALAYLQRSIKVSDDCAANLLSDVRLNDVHDCTECKFLVTATDQRCVGQNPPGAATSSREFVLNVDSVAPVITCGFFTPQDTEHIPGGFDICAGLPPPFPPQDDFLHIEYEDFGKDLIDVAFWYQIETGKLDGVLPVGITVTSNELDGRPVDNLMALVVERRDLPMVVARARIYLAPFSCRDGNRPSPICEQERNNLTTTRFYDINITATDAAGNVGNKTCSVIVVPRGHFQGSQGLPTSKKGSVKGSDKGNRQFRKLQKSIKGEDISSSSSESQTKSGKSAKQNIVNTPHDPNDLRLEYPLSTQRYVISSSIFLWDPQLNTTLTVPPLQNLANGVGSNKSSKKGSSKSTASRCNQQGGSSKSKGGISTKGQQ